MTEGVRLGTGDGSVRAFSGRTAGGYNGATFRACIWDIDNPSQEPTDLGGSGGTEVAGMSGNRIVGNTNTRAVLWDLNDPTASPTELGTPASVYDSQIPDGCIDGDYAVGVCRILPNYDAYAYVWDLTNPTAAPTILNLNGGTSSSSIGIGGRKVVGEIDSVYVVWDLDYPNDAPVNLGFGAYESIWPRSMDATWIVGRIYDVSTDYPGKWATSDPTASPIAMDGVSSVEILAVKGSVGGGRSQPNSNSQATIWDMTGTAVTPLLPIPTQTSYVYAVGVDVVGGVLNSNPTIWEQQEESGVWMMGSKL